MVTPVYNEAKYIAAMIQSVVQQSIPPSKWVIVDDGSSDETAKIVDFYSTRFGFIELVRRRRRDGRLPGGEGAIHDGLHRLQLADYEFLARFDADLIFGHDYMERIFTEFERDPRLGIAGGGLYIEKDGEMELECEPVYHVRGAVKMYRRKCFEQIGTLSTQIGWDTIDEVAAWSLGWKTRSFTDCRVIHCRPTGFGLPPGRIFFERGKAEYFSWSSPLFVLLKAAKIAASDGAPARAARFLEGFLSGYLMNQNRIQNSRFVRTRREQQYRRIKSVLSFRGDRTTQQLQSLESSPHR
jgi:glycosyltransferase involved in cell wall biosynthesis